MSRIHINIHDMGQLALVRKGMAITPVGKPSYGKPKSAALCFLFVHYLFNSLPVSRYQKFRKSMFEFRGNEKVIMLVSW